MAKFCTKCGKTLEEGNVCDCAQTTQTQPEVAVATQPKSNNVNGFDFNKYLNDYIELLKGIFMKPVDTITKFSTSENFLLGVIALVINCLISGIFLYCFCSEAMGLFSSLMGGYGSLLTGTTTVEVPFIKTVLYGIVFMAAGFAVTALMIYVMATVVFKDKIDIKKTFALVGTVSVFTTITTMLCIVLNYISVKFMMIVLMLAGVFYLTYLYQGISELTKVEKNKLAYVFVPAISVATFVVVYILPKILF